MDATPGSPQLLMVGSSVVYPPRTGDSRRMFRVAQAFRHHGISVQLIGKNYRVDPAGKVTVDFDYAFGKDSKRKAAIMTALRRSHYNEVKHATPEALARVKPELDSDKYGCVYSGALYLTPMILPYLRGRQLIVDTHNNEWEWFDGLARDANPLVRFVCDSSKRRADEIMRMLPAGTVMKHVSESDMAAFKQRRPDLVHLVVSNGCDIHPRSVMPDYSETPKRILFFGSMGSQMSFDALSHFRQVFWPVLKPVAKFVVAGAHPRESIVEMCAAEGWELRRDLTEEQVVETFAETHYSILPFAYGTGSKLKFLDACGRGVPVLSTEAGACGQTDSPSYVTISDNPDVWKETIVNGKGPQGDWRGEVAAYGERFQWESVVKPLLPVIRGAGNHPPRS